jgi:hypothetical protein
MTFKEFILACRVSDSPRGDFVDDTQTLIRLDRFPNVDSWEDLEFFLLSRSACPEARTAAKGIWREYEMSELSGKVRHISDAKSH